MEEFISKFASHGYLAVFVLMTLESACIPIPSEVTMLFAGFLTSPEYSGPHLNLIAVALVGTVANLVGSWLAYGAGRTGGRALIERFGRYVLIRAHDIDRAEVWFARHGEAAVFFSRMLPVVRTFISLPAGVAEMPLGRFSLYTFVGSLPWVFALTIAGRALGDRWNSVVSQFNVASIVVAALVAGAIVWWFFRRRRRAQTPGS
jgi:membrane protein DedA with SNARE-associated domain